MVSSTLSSMAAQRSLHSVSRDRRSRVLVIDEERAIGRAVRTGLANMGYEVAWEPTGTAGLERSDWWEPDIVLLDLMLPDRDGLDVCRALRTRSDVPIIVVSMRSRDADKVAAFEQGADDYLTKPFSMAELVARIQVALRHAARVAHAAVVSHAMDGIAPRGTRYRTGGLEIDFARRLVRVDGVVVHLTPTEYAVLSYLAVHAGAVVTRGMLLWSVWGPEQERAIHSLRVFINTLRHKIEPDPTCPRYLHTERGVGYRLHGDE